MEFSSPSFDDGAPIPDEYAFARPDPERHATFSANRNPALAWSGLPAACRSLALLCIDVDAPTVPDDVNREGRTVPADLPRADFHHWVMIDVPPEVTGVAAGACCDRVWPRGQTSPGGPPGSRQGLNDYTGWFAGDPEMKGRYFGYDGPGPPWNDERVHRYRFDLYALDVQRLAVEGEFTGPEVLAAIEGHVLDRASWTGSYTLVPSLRR